MPVPDYQSLMRPALAAAEFGEISVKDMTERVADHFALTPEDGNERMKSGCRLIINRLAWARIYLTKAGLLRTTRPGFVTITEQGRAALIAHPDRIDHQSLKSYPLCPDVGGLETSPDATVTETPEERLRTTHADIEATLKFELIDRILSVSAPFFEKVVISLLLAMGYGGSPDAGRVLGRSGDNGVDGVIDQDALGLDRIYVQAKRYSRDKPVGSSEVRDFFGGLDHHRATKGLFVTTSSFTKSAIRTAEQLSKRIVLIDGSRLADLLIQYGVGTRVEKTFYIRRMDDGYFSGE